MEPSRGRDPLSCSGDLPHQMGQRDGIKQHQRPRRRRHVDDRFAAVQVSTIAVDDRGDDCVCRRLALPVPRRARGIAGLCVFWIGPTRADLLERLPRLVVEELGNSMG